MAQQPSEDKKIDLSSLPRGAIGIKGLPINRNTRLPSIRSPRDLTLGAPSKRTFIPNIPPRREKKQAGSESKSTPAKGEDASCERKNASNQSDRGRGRGRGRGQIIQTQGAVFGDGIAENVLSRKEKSRDSYLKSDYAVSSKDVSVKREKDCKDVADVSRKMDELFRDDFIDDEDDDISVFPTMFPPVAQVKKEMKSNAETASDFNPDIAKEVGFDVNKVAKFIKKEKGTDIEEKKKIEGKKKIPDVPADFPGNKILNLLNDDVPQLLLAQLPPCITVPQKRDDSQPETQKGQSGSADPKASDVKSPGACSISSLPEGYIGKLQVMKSGKTRLVIRGLIFDLNSISTLHSKHEIVSIRTDTDPGDLCVLGSVKHQLVFTPNLDFLLR